MRAFISIGLNVGSAEPIGQLHKTFAAVARHFAIVEQAVGQSEWQGVPERFVQFEVFSPRSTKAFAQIIAEMAGHLQQDAISYAWHGASDWILMGRDGRASWGGTLDEYPIIVNATRAAA